ncbi:T9SS type A sorting domain-containing protein, partial [Cyclobacteriaceae bacterium]|nr:T9SS type A sorting domain-containing protein [Cyclobacteriaceae bacterium]
TVDVDANNVCDGTTQTLSVIASSGLGTPTYSWKVNGFEQSTTGTLIKSDFQDADKVVLEVNSSEACVTSSLATSNEVTVNVNSPVTPTVVIDVDVNSVCEATAQTFRVVSSSDLGLIPTYSWKVNGVNESTASTLVKSDLADTDKITLEVTSSESCVTSSIATSNEITADITSAIIPTVAIDVDVNSICEGVAQTFSVTSSSDLGLTPTYSWKVNGSEVGTTDALITSSLVNSDDVILEVTSSDNCISGNAVSNTISIVATTPLVPSVTIVSDLSGTCTGETQTLSIDASANLGGAPTYSWKVNGVVESTTATLSKSDFQDADQVVLEITSSEPCVTGIAISNTITIDVNTTLDPLVSIAIDTNNVCAGLAQTFSVATSSNLGGLPTYSWKVNGVVESTTATLSKSDFQDADKVVLEVNSSEACVTSSLATSNEITVNVSSPVTPTVVIDVDVNSVCEGTAQTFSVVSSSDLGLAPTYSWKVNGSEESVASTFVKSDFVNGDVVTLDVTPVGVCVTGNPVSNSVVVNTTTNLNPAVAIITDVNDECEGKTHTLSIVSSSHLGLSPTYSWKVNGGEESVTTTLVKSDFQNGDQVTLEVTSSETCVTGVAISNVVTISTIAPLVPTVVVDLDANDVCEGTTQTLSVASASDLGLLPTYSWKVNGVVESTTATLSKSDFQNTDQVVLEVVSSESCVTGVATSNAVDIIITTIVTPAVTVSLDQNDICEGEEIVCTANVTDGGLAPAYSWEVNGAEVSTGAQLTKSDFVNGDQIQLTVISSLACVTTTTVASQIETVNVIPTTSNSSNIPDQVQELGFTTYDINLDNYFEGQNLIYTASASTVVNTSIAGNLLTISSNQEGQEDLTIGVSGDCGTSFTVIKFDIQQPVIIPPVVDVTSPSEDFIIMTEGESLDLSLDIQPGEGAISSVSAVIIEPSTTNEENISLSTSGSIYTGSWLSTTGTYKLQITATNSSGGTTIVEKNVFVNAAVASVSFIAFSDGQVITDPSSVLLEANVFGNSSPVKEMTFFIYVNDVLEETVVGDATGLNADWTTFANEDNYSVVAQVELQDGLILSSSVPVYFSVNITTSLGADLAINSAVAYPNPFTSNVNVSVDSRLNQEVSVVVYTSVGTEVFVGTVSFNVGENEFALDTEQWGEGVYILSIMTSEGVHSIKIEK